MKGYFLFTAGGPLVILTSYDYILNPMLLRRLESKGIKKFIAYKISLEVAKTKYGQHFDVVLQDLQQTDDLRVLDYSGERAFRKFSFKELASPIYCEPKLY